MGSRCSWCPSSPGRRRTAAGSARVLVPCSAGGLKDRRWGRGRAVGDVVAIGSNVVVANSLVITEILRAPTPVGTAIAVAPGHAAVGQASEPDDVLVFALEPE